MFDYTKTNQVGLEIGLKRETLSPHPDGKAWPKCCRNLPTYPSATLTGSISCAFIPRQYNGARLSSQSGLRRASYDGYDYVTVSETPFMCAHRTTVDGHHRVCAGWDACFGNKAIASKSTTKHGA